MVGVHKPLSTSELDNLSWLYIVHMYTYKLFLFLLMQILYLWVLLASFNILNCVHSQGMSLTLALPYFTAALMNVHIDRVHNAHVLVSSDVFNYKE